MALEPAITDMEQLKTRPEVAALLAVNASAVTGAKFDRNELTIWVDRVALRDCCQALRNNSQLQYNALADVTCVDWYPKEPRFEVVYQLFSTANKKYLRLKVRLSGDDANVMIEVLEPDKRPVSATADHTEFRNVVKVEVMEESGIDIFMMFDPGHTLAERILAEQFGF